MTEEARSRAEVLAGGGRSLFLAPHNDDEVLYGAFTLLRFKPKVVVVLRSFVQQERGYGIHYSDRENETDDAMRILGGIDWEQWTYSDADPDWDGITQRLWAMRDMFDHCFAPMPEPVGSGGHEHHDKLGAIANHVFLNHCTRYATYRRGHSRTRTDTPVEIPPEWISLKLEALSVYQSQSGHESCAPHFLDVQTEFYEC